MTLIDIAISAVQIDLCVGNELGCQNTLLLKAYCEADTRIYKLLLAVKQWASKRYLNNAKSGLLSSFSWCLLALYAAKCHFAYRLPQFLLTHYAVEQLKRTSEDIAFQTEGHEMFHLQQPRSDHSSDSVTAGELLLHFFTYFGCEDAQNFSYLTGKISLHDNTVPSADITIGCHDTVNSDAEDNNIEDNGSDSSNESNGEGENKAEHAIIEALTRKRSTRPRPWCIKIEDCFDKRDLGKVVDSRFHQNYFIGEIHRGMTILATTGRMHMLDAWSCVCEENESLPEGGFCVCGSCDHVGHIKEFCPFAKCKICRRKGHLQSVCSLLAKLKAGHDQDIEDPAMRHIVNMKPRCIDVSNVSNQPFLNQPAIHPQLATSRAESKPKNHFIKQTTPSKSSTSQQLAVQTPKPTPRSAKKNKSQSPQSQPELARVDLSPVNYLPPPALPSHSQQAHQNHHAEQRNQRSAKKKQQTESQLQSQPQTQTQPSLTSNVQPSISQNPAVQISKPAPRSAKKSKAQAQSQAQTTLANLTSSDAQQISLSTPSSQVQQIRQAEQQNQRSARKRKPQSLPQSQPQTQPQQPSGIDSLSSNAQSQETQGQKKAYQILKRNHRSTKNKQQPQPDSNQAGGSPFLPPAQDQVHPPHPPSSHLDEQLTVLHLSPHMGQSSVPSQRIKAPKVQPSQQNHQTTVLETQLKSPRPKPQGNPRRNKGKSADQSASSLPTSS